MKGTKWALLIILILAFICMSSFTTWTDEQLHVRVELIRILLDHGGRIAFSPDGKLLAVSWCGGYDEENRWCIQGGIQLIDVASGQVVRTLIGHSGGIESLAFTPDGKLLASSSCKEPKEWVQDIEGGLYRHLYRCIQGEIKLWDVGTGREVRSLTAHVDASYSLAFSPDGKLLASGSCARYKGSSASYPESPDTCIQGEIKLWDVDTGREVRSLILESHVNSLAFSPDGQLLASGSCGSAISRTYPTCRQGEIKLWEVATGRQIRTLAAHVFDVYSVAFSPDGKLLASGSCGDVNSCIPKCSPYCRQGEIKLWDTANFREVYTLTGHNGTVKSLAFGLDGRLLVSSSDSIESSIILWDVATGRLAQDVDLSRFVESPPVSGIQPPGYVFSAEMVTFSPDGQALAVSTSKGIMLLRVQTKENEPPQASFTFPPAQPRVGESVRFDASASSDPDGTITSYAWDFGDGSTGSGKITTHTYNRSETFTVTLTVTDDDGVTDSTSKTITVIKANEPPRAEFTYSPERPLAGQQVTFDASTSSDPDGSNIINYEWDFGDGTEKNYGMIATHIFSEEGTYTIKLTITDDDGATASTEQEVKVLQSGGGGGPA